MRRIEIIPLLVTGFLVAGCASKPVTPNQTTGSPASGAARELTGAGATFPAPLYQQWGSEYEKKFGVRINYQSIGSGGGVQQITARTVDFGASDAPLKEDELAKAPGAILHIPTVFGAVVVTYNLGEPKSALKLTPEDVAGIFLGKIKKWSDPALAQNNRALPDTDIQVVHRSDGSGTTNIFTNYLSFVSDEWKSKVGSGKEVAWPVGLGGKGNEGVTALVKQTPGAIGYVELAYAKQNSMPVASIKNRSGKFIAPNLQSVTAAAGSAQVPDDLRFSIVDAPGADAYPISGATWLLVYKDQTDEAKGRALVAFLDWAIHDGQKFAEPLLYAKLPSSLVAKAEGKVREIDFQGSSILR